jgi:hypothetical protein
MLAQVPKSLRSSFDHAAPPGSSRIEFAGALRTRIDASATTRLQFNAINNGAKRQSFCTKGLLEYEH